MAISCEQCREHLSELLEESSATSSGTTSAVGGASLSTAAATAAATTAGDLSRAALEEHVASCADCTSDLMLLRHAREALRALPALSAPDDLRSRIRAQIEDTPAKHATLQAVAPRRSILEGLATFFRQPARVAWASGAALATFVLLIVASSRPLRQEMIAPDTPAMISAPPETMEKSTGTQAPAKARDEQRSQRSGAAQRSGARGGTAAQAKPGFGKKPRSSFPVARSARTSGARESAAVKGSPARDRKQEESTPMLLSEARPLSPPSPSFAPTPNSPAPGPAPSPGPASTHPRGNKSLQDSLAKYRSDQRQTPSVATPQPSRSQSANGAPADNVRNPAHFAASRATTKPRLARLQLLPSEEQRRDNARSESLTSVKATTPRPVQPMRDEGNSPVAGFRSRASAGSTRSADLEAREGAEESRYQLKSAPPQARMPAAIPMPGEPSDSRKGSPSADAAQDPSVERRNAPRVAPEGRLQSLPPSSPGTSGGFGGGGFGGAGIGVAPDRVGAPAPSTPTAPPSLAIDRSVLRQAGATSSLADGLRLGETRGARLIVTPPRDVAAAQVRVELSSGLRFSDQVPGGSQTGIRIVWQGAARKDQPIAVVMSLAGVAVGMQSVQVTLLEETRQDATNAVDSETVLVNVLAR